MGIQKNIPRRAFRNLKWRAFFAAERGGVLIFMALAMVALLAAVGGAVDISRAYTVKARLAHAVDAAGLAVGSTLQATDAEMQQVLESFFSANYPADALGTPATPTMVIDGDTITVTASAEIDSTFMRIIGHDSISVSASAEIVRDLDGLEVALVLDNTGSMAGSKIESLREASLDLVQILFGDIPVHEKLKIGVIPYVVAVNAGDVAPTLITGPDQATYDPDEDEMWMGCLRARTYPDDTLDTEMAVGGTWTRFWWESASDNDWPSVSFSRGPNLTCPTPITPLTNVRATVDSALNAMAAAPGRGGTLSNLGMIWGWRVLSPEVPFTEGLPYNDPDNIKVAVLMTDGVNQIVRRRGSPFLSDYTAYGRVDDGVLGTTDRFVARDIVNERLAEICTNMKNAGIVVYTITFQLNDADTQAIYRTCASDPAKYFDSPNSQSLNATFQAIGHELSNLRLSQ